MAKRSKSGGAAESGGAEPATGGPHDPTPQGQASDVLGDFAADLGKFLGGVQNRAASWLQQRKEIADQLTQIRDTANQYLQQLTGGSQVTTPSMLVKEVARREGQPRRGRPPGRRNTALAAQGSSAPEEAVEQPAKPKRTMSAEARARIADAQRKRWAKVRRGTRNADR